MGVVGACLTTLVTLLPQVTAISCLVALSSYLSLSVNDGTISLVECLARNHRLSRAYTSTVPHSLTTLTVVIARRHRHLRVTTSINAGSAAPRIGLQCMSYDKFRRNHDGTDERCGGRARDHRSETLAVFRDCSITAIDSRLKANIITSAGDISSSQIEAGVEKRKRLKYRCSRQEDTLRKMNCRDKCERRAVEQCLVGGDRNSA